MKTELYVVRHGRTALNKEDRYLGAIDPPLDEVGMEQAHELAEALHGRSSAVISSPLLRAQQTAQILSEKWNARHETCAFFAERNVGVYEGLTKDEARRNYPDLWQQNITRQWDKAPPGGESIQEVFIRVSHGMTFIRNRFADQSVVLVAHGFVAKVIHALANKVSEESFFAYTLKNGEFAHYSLPHNLTFDPVIFGAAQPRR